MPRVRLTAKNVQTLPYAGKGKGTDYRDTILPGLVLRVWKGGVRTWVVEYHEQRGPKSVGRRHKLARLDRLVLAKARDQAREILPKIAAGEPLTSGRDLTVAKLVAKMLEGLKHLRPATRKEWDRLLDVEIRDSIGDTLADRLTRAEVRTWYRALGARSPAVATHAIAVLKRAYSWGVQEDLLPYSPVVGIRNEFKPEPSERVLSSLEVGALVRCLGRQLGRFEEEPYRDATTLLLLTGVRRAAVLGARRAEFHELDGEAPHWIIPGGALGRSKNRQPHIVPLSAPAVAVVKRRLLAVETAHLFPRSHQEHGVDLPAGWPTRWVNTLKAAVEGDLFPRPEKTTAEEWAKGAPRVPAWKVHGLRHTLSTHLREDLGVDSEVVELILAHARAGVRGVYDRSKLLPQRRAALVAWAAWLEKVARKEEAGGATVLPFAR